MGPATPRSDRGEATTDIDVPPIRAAACPDDLTAPPADLAWLAGLRSRSAALLVDGPPGAGKSHRLGAVFAAAGEDGFRVLYARPARSETVLVGSALIDLTEHVTDDELALLPPAQAAALSAALMRGGGGAGDLTPQAVVVAFTTLLRTLAAGGPLLVVVDDVQWLDPQTSSVLAFAARRLPAAGIGVALAMRTETRDAAHADPVPEPVTALGASVALTRVTVPPLSDPELEQVVRRRLGPSLTARTMATAVGLAAGNPLFAIEVARSARERRALDDGPWVPASLADLVGREIDRLPRDTRDAVAAAAALRRPTLGQLRTLGLADGLPAAEHAGLVRVDGGHVVFVHPLYAAAAYDTLAGSERTRLHARLADVVTGHEERARHLALGSEVPDDTVAAALDVARDQALGRGATHAAAEACRLALRATRADDPARAVRLVHLGRLLYRVGESALARAELEQAVELAADPHVRARAMHELSRVVCDTESEQAAAAIALAALPLAAGDPALEADLHMGLAVCRVDDWRAAVEHARTAIDLLDADPDTPAQKLALALTSLAAASFYAGDGADLEACRRAVDLEGDACTAPVADRAICVLAYLSVWVDDFVGAEQCLARSYDIAVAEGDEASRAYVLSLTAALALRRGDWDRAQDCVAEQEELCRLSGNEYFGRSARQHAAWLAAYRGDLGTALVEAEADIRAGVEGSSAMAEQRGRGLAGFCALAAGDAERAATELTRYLELFTANGAGEPALRQLAADHVEALVAVDRLDEARAALAAVVGPAARLGRTAVLAAAARGEALLLAAEGDLPAALAAADHSVQAYDALDRPLERARALLVRGRLHRRARHKSLARDDLAAARDEFVRLGAAGFAAAATEDLLRTGLRPAAPTGRGGLTATEARIAELAATGMTSAEIATTLFVSTKTVSANLTHIYRKLGVRNRSELTVVVTTTGVPRGAEPLPR